MFARLKEQVRQFTSNSEPLDPFVVPVTSFHFGCDHCSKLITRSVVVCAECEDFCVCSDCWSLKKEELHAHPFFIVESVQALEEFQRSHSSFLKLPSPLPDPAEIILNAAAVYQSLPCLGEYIQNQSDIDTSHGFLQDEQTTYKGWKWNSFSHVAQSAIFLAEGLRQTIPIDKKTTVGICGKNSSEWIISSFACCLSNVIWVGIHYEFNPKILAHIIQSSGISLLFCDQNSTFQQLLVTTFREFPVLQKTLHIVFFDSNGTLSINKYLYEQQISIQTFSELETQGKHILKGKIEHFERINILIDETMCLVYTSGSTGTAKGVIQDRRTWSFHMLSGYRQTRLLKKGVKFSFAPFSHSSSIRHVYRAFHNGSKTGLFGSRDYSLLTKSINSLKPDALSGTPRFWIFLMEEYKMLLSKLEQSHPELDAASMKKLCISTFLTKMGGRVRSASVGGALPSKVIFQFMEDCFGMSMGDGFGITECGPVMAGGILIEGVEAQLLDVPEMGYFGPNKGELCIKSPSMMKGYWNDDKGTKEAFTEDGFYKTGDICSFNEGKFTVIGRRKFHFKLSSGEFLVPDSLEALYSGCPGVSQLFIHGNSKYNSAVGIIVPARAEIEGRMSDEELSDHFTRHFVDIAEKDSLMPHEIIRTVIISREAFTEENGLLTPSGKLRRVALISRYQDAILTALEDSTLKWKQFLTTNIAQILDINKEQVDFTKSFQALGGDSMSAARIKKLLKGKVPDTFLEYLLNQGSLQSTLATSSAFSLEEDLKLDTSEMIGTATRYEELTGGETVLLTGATGFVGAFLLEALLLRDCNCHVICLVRTPEKLKYVLDLYDIHLEKFENNFSILQGDLSLPDFGVSDENYHILVHSVDIVFHCAAWVNFYLTYKELRRSNVLGTKEILRFCSVKRCGNKIPSLCYISTNSVILQSSRSVIKEEDELLVGNWNAVLRDSLSRGYASTKFVAEKIVWDWIEAGGNAFIFRLGTVSGHSVTGSMNESDFLARIFAAFVHVGSSPLLESGCFMNIIPVDYACHSIVSIFYECLKQQSINRLFHINNPNPCLSFKSFSNYLLELKNFTLCTYPEWKEAVTSNPAAVKILGSFIDSILGATSIPSLEKSPRFDSSVARTMFPGEILCPPITNSMINSYIAFIQRNQKPK